MFKFLSRAIPVLVVLVLIGSLLGGCGGEQRDAASKGDGGLSGTLQVNGSTTIAPIAQAWAEAFHEKHPGVEVIVSGTGSGNGIAALINGTTDIAMASRKIKDEERKAFPGGSVKEYVVGRDGLAVIVHPSNPVRSLTLEQIKGIFTGKITDWEEVGGRKGKIIVYTRDTSSGTYEFFKEFVLNDEDFAENARRTASNAAMVKSVAQEENAIGYCALGFVDKSVSALAVDKGDGVPVEPSFENARAGKYPIVRDLNMYTTGETDELARAFLDFGLSDEGQSLVQEVGYLPVK